MVRLTATRGNGSGQRRGTALGVLRRCLLLGLLALVFASGCREVTVGEPRALSITLEVERVSGTVGDSVVFMYEAEGQALVEIRIAFGDGVADTVSTFGAQTAAGSLSHTYQEGGDFQVVAEAEEGGGPISADSLIFPVVGPLIR